MCDQPTLIGMRTHLKTENGLSFSYLLGDKIMPRVLQNIVPFRAAASAAASTYIKAGQGYR